MPSPPRRTGSEAVRLAGRARPGPRRPRRDDARADGLRGDAEAARRPARRRGSRSSSSPRGRRRPTCRRASPPAPTTTSASRSARASSRRASRPSSGGANARAHWASPPSSSARVSAIFLLAARLSGASRSRVRSSAARSSRRASGPLALALVGDDDVELPAAAARRARVPRRGDRPVLAARGGRVARRGSRGTSPTPRRTGREIRSLGDRRAWRRATAAYRLGDMACRDAGPALVDRLRDDDARRPRRHGPQPRPARLRGGGAAARRWRSSTARCRGRSRSAPLLDLGPAAAAVSPRPRERRGRRAPRGRRRADRLRRATPRTPTCSSPRSATRPAEVRARGPPPRSAGWRRPRAQPR